MFEKLHYIFNELTHRTKIYKHSDPKFATVALLSHVMAVDGHIDKREEKILHDIVFATLAHGEVETLGLIAQAKRDEKQSFDFNIYINALKNNLSKQTIHLILQEMMEIMLADTKIRELEVGYILRVAEILGLSAQETQDIYKNVLQKAKD